MKRLTLVAVVVIGIACAPNTDAASRQRSADAITAPNADAEQLFRQLRQLGFAASSIDGDEIKLTSEYCLKVPETTMRPVTVRRMPKPDQDALNAKASMLIARSPAGKPPQFCVDPTRHC